MRKTIIMAGILVAISILMSACAQQKAPSTQDNSAIAQDTSEGQASEPSSGSNAGAMDDAGSQTSDTGQQEEGDTMTSDTGTSDTGTQEDVMPSDTGVTQEELDDLKKDIDGMEFDDLEGLSD